jgi:hypothetical protein
VYWSEDDVADVPPGVVTIISGDPAVALDGAIKVIKLAVSTVIFLMGTTVLPNLTTVALLKAVPVIITTVLPVVGPDVGAMLDTTGRAIYVYDPDKVAVWPSPMVTTRFWAPAVPAGVVAVIVVELTKLTLVAALPPMVTASEVPAVCKFVPVIVTD